VGKQLVLQQPARAEQPGANGPDWYASDSSGFLVTHLFHVHEHDGNAKRVGQLTERAIDRRTDVDAIEQVAFATLYGGEVAVRRGERFSSRIC
jgi:hypothetical protein